RSRASRARCRATGRRASCLAYSIVQAGALRPRRRRAAEASKELWISPGYRWSVTEPAGNRSPPASRRAARSALLPLAEGREQLVPRRRGDRLFGQAAESADGVAHLLEVQPAVGAGRQG